MKLRYCIHKLKTNFTFQTFEMPVLIFFTQSFNKLTVINKIQIE